MELAHQIAAATADDHEAATLLQRETVRKLLKVFEPVYAQNPGRQGFVSIQSDPFLEEETENIVREALACRELGPNVISKIPATAAGLKALELVMREGIPVIATEMMSVAQTLAVLEVWERVRNSMPDCPVLFVTHITGIFDECLQKQARADGVELRNERLRQAGRLVARKVYDLVHERRDGKLTMLGGGARRNCHFTDMVGADMHVTINPSMALELIEENTVVEERFFDPMDPVLIEELHAHLPIFRKAWDQNGLSEEEFETFAPVRYFRDMFLAGWKQTMAQICGIRTEQGKLVMRQI
jgi:transaldolase